VAQADFGGTIDVTAGLDAGGFSDIGGGGALELVPFFPPFPSPALLPMSSVFVSLPDGRSRHDLAAPPGLRSSLGRCRPICTVSHCPSASASATRSLLGGVFARRIVGVGDGDFVGTTVLPFGTRDFALC